MLAAIALYVVQESANVMNNDLLQVHGKAMDEQM
jgi:hypothetical protein